MRVYTHTDQSPILIEHEFEVELNSDQISESSFILDQTTYQSAYRRRSQPANAYLKIFRKIERSSRPILLPEKKTVILSTFASTITATVGSSFTPLARELRNSGGIYHPPLPAPPAHSPFVPFAAAPCVAVPLVLPSPQPPSPPVCSSAGGCLQRL